MRRLILAALAACAFACSAQAQDHSFPTPGNATVGGNVQMCLNSSGNAVPVSSGTCANPAQVAGTFTASLGGFTPSTSGARGTPLSVTTADTNGALPTGAVVVVSNVGTTNPMYCNVNGVAATTSDELITANGGWFAFTIPSGITTLHCIATGGTTTANMVGGSGLPTGTGGGSGGGSSSAITAWGGATLGAATAVGTEASGNVPTVNAHISGGLNANGQSNNAGSAPVVLSNQQMGATGSAVLSAAPLMAGDAQSSEATKATTGNLTPAMLDLVGKTVTSPFANRENFLNCAVTDTVNTATTCTGMGAQGASVKIYITDLCISRNDAGTTAVSATLNDSATTIIDVPNNGGGGGFCKTYNVPLQVAANTAFQVTMSSAITSVHISASGYKGY